MNAGPSSVDRTTPGASRRTLASAKRSHASPRLVDHHLDEVESVAGIGSYTLEVHSGHWVSSRGLDAIFGIDTSFVRSVEGWASLMHPLDRDAMVAYFADEVVGRARPFDREYRIVRADTGEVRWVRGRGALEVDGSGRPVRMLGTIADVTDQRQAQELLEESELEMRRMSAAIEQSAEGIVITDPDWRIVYANAAYAASVGREPSELVGRSATEVVSIGLDPATVAAMFRTVSAGQRWATEVDHHFPDGSLHRFETNIGPIHDPAGAITSWVAVIRDVTDRHLAEREMRRLSTAIGQSSDAVVITDTSGAIEYVNPAFERVTGYTSAEVLGQNPRILKSGVQGPAFYAAMWATLTSGQSFVGDLTNRRKDGSLFEEEAVISPIRDEAGTITSYVAVKRNVTERKRLEAERDRLATAVEQAADFIIVDDASGTIHAVNPAFERLTGYSADKAVGRRVANLLRSGVDPPEVYAALDAAMLHGTAWIGRVAERRADGGLLHVDLSLSPIRDATGNLVGTVEIGRDRTRESELEAERAREAQVRVALAESLARIPADATLEQAAHALCDDLARLPFVDVAEVEIFLEDQRVEMLAVAGPPVYPAIVGSRLPDAGAARVRERCAHGPWAGLVTDDPADGFIPGCHAAGLRALAYGPIVYGGEVRGSVVLGTFDEAYAPAFVEDLPGIASFGATASALLGERMHARRVERERRDAFDAAIATGAFHPVFQPIVDLGTGEAMGYEALTRFDSGQRPDRCFADAWTVGLGPELELATLEAAVDAAKALPAGTWLDLNVSPRLLAAPGRLREILWAADRPIVLEVTEHELIEDYEAVRKAIRSLGRDIRLAVDDAGAGVANFGHIIDLRPDFVKLDISLVRRVNANLGRQAMVVGMRHFSRTAGCRLIAEGVETEEEAATLRTLGVEFGQGYLFGHPEASHALRAAARPRSKRRAPEQGAGE